MKFLALLRRAKAIQWDQPFATHTSMEWKRRHRQIRPQLPSWDLGIISRTARSREARYVGRQQRSALGRANRTVQVRIQTAEGIIMVGCTIFGAGTAGPALQVNNPASATDGHAMFHSMTVVENQGGGISGCCEIGTVHYVGVVAAGNLVDDVHLTHTTMNSLANVRGDAVFNMGDVSVAPGWIQHMPVEPLSNYMTYVGILNMSWCNGLATCR